MQFISSKLFWKNYLSDSSNTETSLDIYFKAINKKNPKVAPGCVNMIL